MSRLDYVRHQIALIERMAPMPQGAADELAELRRERAELEAPAGVGGVGRAATRGPSRYTWRRLLAEARAEALEAAVEAAGPLHDTIGRLSRQLDGVERLAVAVAELEAVLGLERQGRTVERAAELLEQLLDGTLRLPDDPS